MKIQVLIVLFLIPFIVFSQKSIKVNSDYTDLSKYSCRYARVYKTDSNKRLDFYNCNDQKVISREYVRSFNHKQMDIFREIHGEELFFDTLGNIIKRCCYIKGKKIGVEKEFYSNGDIKKISFYKNGLKTDEEIEYHPDGKIKSKCTYDNGLKTGLETEFYSDGNTKRISNYLKNKKVQKETLFFSNGKVSSIKYYNKGLLDGTELSFSILGDTISNVIYMDGKPFNGFLKVIYKNGYEVYEKYEDFQLMGIYTFDENHDTSTAYEYHFIDSKRLIRCIKYYENGKLIRTNNYDINYRDEYINPKTKKVIKRDTIINKTDTTDKIVSFLGGLDSLNLFIENNLNYPRLAIDKKMSCVVMVIFIVGKEGNIIDIFADEKCDKVFNDEAIRVISFTNGCWTPGTYLNKNVMSICRIPITFEIMDDY